MSVPLNCNGPRKEPCGAPLLADGPDSGPGLKYEIITNDNEATIIRLSKTPKHETFVFVL